MRPRGSDDLEAAAAILPFPQIERRPAGVPPGYIGYEEAAARLGITLPAFRNRYGSKYFVTVQVGNRRYVPSVAIDMEIARRASRRAPKLAPAATPAPGPLIRPEVDTYDGELCAAGYTLFKQGVSVIDAVIELRQTFEIVEHIWDGYRRHSGSVLIDGKSARQFASMFDYGSDVLDGPTLVRAAMRFKARTLAEAEKIRQEVAESSPASGGQEGQATAPQAREGDDESDLPPMFLR